VEHESLSTHVISSNESRERHMYAPYHLAAGALTEKGIKTRVPTAGVALLSAALLDNLLLRSSIIEPIQHIDSPWPPDTPAILQIVPYPADLLSTFILVVLVIVTPALVYLMRRYWWGMLWAVLPDIIDWVILNPTIGKHPVHDLFDALSTPWGLAVEVTIIVIIVGTVLWRRRRSNWAGRRNREKDQDTGASQYHTSLSDKDIRLTKDSVDIDLLL
jgi:hypothetical protein